MKNNTDTSALSLLVPSLTITKTLAVLLFSWQDRCYARLGTGTGHADFIAQAGNDDA